MTPYQRLLAERLGSDFVIERVARSWGVPRWVIDDALRGKVKAPSSRYLRAVAAGLGMTVGELMDEITPEAPAPSPT
jgi:hypothetical protein